MIYIEVLVAKTLTMIYFQVLVAKTLNYDLSDASTGYEDMSLTKIDLLVFFAKT
jgi:hypothetical protein